jgi:hypothetical protein
MAGLFVIDQPPHDSFCEIELQAEFIPFAHFAFQLKVPGVFIAENDAHGAGVCDTAWVEVAKGVALELFGEDPEDDPVFVKTGEYLDAETGFLPPLYALLEAEDTRLA